MQRALAMLIEDVPDDILRHAPREVRVDHADDRHSERQRRIPEQSIDSSTEIEDDAQVRQRGDQPRFGLPGRDIAYGPGIDWIDAMDENGHIAEA
jgi:hypothetical protein